MGENIPKVGGPNSTTYHLILGFIILGNGPHLSASPNTGKPIKIFVNFIPYLLVRIDQKIF